jgi:voltage-gated potassium channel
VNPRIPDYFTALYFGVTTLTTVGFGDITPVTSQGRLVVICSILAGVAVIPAQAASLAEAYLDFQKERSMGQRARSAVGAKDMRKNRICRNCGSGPHRHDALFCYNCGDALDDRI